MLGHRKIMEIETITTKTLEEQLAEKRNAELQQCVKEINELLTKYNCSLTPTMVLKGGVLPEVKVEITPNK